MILWELTKIVFRILVGKAKPAKAMLDGILISRRDRNRGNDFLFIFQGHLSLNLFNGKKSWDWTFKSILNPNNNLRFLPVRSLMDSRQISSFLNMILNILENIIIWERLQIDNIQNVSEFRRKICFHTQQLYWVTPHDKETGKKRLPVWQCSQSAWEFSHWPSFILFASM